MNLSDLLVRGSKVLVRVDFNVPLDEQGNISDDTRIQASLPTISYLLKQGASVILMSHLGRPKGERNEKYSLKPCAERLSELLNMPVQFCEDCIGKKAEKMAGALKPNEVLLLENLRFYPAEEKPSLDPSFAQNLSKLADFYVNDAFAASHRDHSSITTITTYFSGRKAMGLLLEKEVLFLGEYFAHPKHPFYAILGGSKISTKLGVLKSLLDKVDGLFLGGGMAFPLLKACGIEIGDSLCEDELISEAKNFLELAKQKKASIFLPKDLVIADRLSQDAQKKIVLTEKGIPQGWMGVDIGPITRTEWGNTLQNANMIFWNGPLGVFEISAFSEGTHVMASFLAHSDAMTIAGGGDSTHAINSLHLSKKFTHISTGGGATLEWIEKGHLPGVDAILSDSV